MRIKAIISIGLIFLALFLTSENRKKIEWRANFYLFGFMALGFWLGNKLIVWGALLQGLLDYIYLPSMEASASVMNQLLAKTLGTYNYDSLNFGATPFYLIILIVGIIFWQSSFFERFSYLLGRRWSPVKKLHLTSAELFVFWASPCLGAVAPLIVICSSKKYNWHKSELATMGLIIFSSNTLGTLALLRFLEMPTPLLAAGLFFTLTGALLVSRILFPFELNIPLASAAEMSNPKEFAAPKFTLDSPMKPINSESTLATHTEEILQTILSVIQTATLGYCLYLCFKWSIQIGDNFFHFFNSYWASYLGQNISLTSFFKWIFYPLGILMQLRLSDLNLSADILVSKFLYQEYVTFFKLAAIQKQLSPEDWQTLTLALIPFGSISVFFSSLLIWNLHMKRIKVSLNFQMIFKIGFGALASSIVSVNLFYLIFS